MNNVCLKYRVCLLEQWFIDIDDWYYYYYYVDIEGYCMRLFIFGLFVMGFVWVCLILVVVIFGGCNFEQIYIEVLRVIQVQ